MEADEALDDSEYEVDENGRPIPVLREGAVPDFPNGVRFRNCTCYSQLEQIEKFSYVIFTQRPNQAVSLMPLI